MGSIQTLDFLTKSICEILFLHISALILRRRHPGMKKKLPQALSIDLGEVDLF